MHFERILVSVMPAKAGTQCFLAKSDDGRNHWNSPERRHTSTGASWTNWLCSVVVAFLLISTSVFGSDIAGSGAPVKYISSCEMDLNGDGSNDIAMLLETLSGRELIVLIGTKEGYQVGLVKRDIGTMFLSCELGATVRGIREGDSTGTEIAATTSGSYLQLFEPEGSSMAIFWSGAEFKELWTSD